MAFMFNLMLQLVLKKAKRVCALAVCFKATVFLHYSIMIPNKRGSLNMMLLGRLYKRTNPAPFHSHHHLFLFLFHCGGFIGCLYS